jgi:hypothetical protein
MSSVSAPSGAPLAAAALPTPEEVRCWRKEDVTTWAIGSSALTTTT